ncbi:hypothetical protein [Streptomyces flaveolus]|uniref:hypothetical protein n=1 Tax=Streptomyces flaveolus TaxID=67297 RepID=UPI00166F934D|nr:hypothetical protein [Streptomyces flaveolus]GGQ80994.1 hypothetical protein GCM10010216_48540 [Streptomyces flaveolus]
MSARDDILRHPGILATADADVVGLLDAYRAEILAEAKIEAVGWLVKKAREYRATGSQQHAYTADAIETLASKVDRGAVRAFLGTGHYRDVMDEHRAEVRRETLGDDLNPSRLVLDAQAYRRLADDVLATMPDPDRWDLDGDEAWILAQYVKHIAAQLALASEFRVPLPEGLGGYGEIVVQRESTGSDRWAVTDGALCGLRAWIDGDGWRYVSEVGRRVAFACSLDEALDLAEVVAKMMQEQHDAAIRAYREGGESA